MGTSRMTQQEMWLADQANRRRAERSEAERRARLTAAVEAFATLLRADPEFAREVPPDRVFTEATAGGMPPHDAADHPTCVLLTAGRCLPDAQHPPDGLVGDLHVEVRGRDRATCSRLVHVKDQYLGSLGNAWFAGECANVAPAGKDSPLVAALRGADGFEHGFFMDKWSRAGADEDNRRTVGREWCSGSRCEVPVKVGFYRIAHVFKIVIPHVRRVRT
ncbi:hypothetical protein [Gemmata sp.]|uniref:hypothetical protein n=1 Tax=Gemmata sp. TaxID=1914242 RepID=UPI003F70CA97